LEFDPAAFADLAWWVARVVPEKDRDYTEVLEGEVSLSDEDKSWINEQLDRVREQVERIETSLLTEFHKWASPVEARQRSHTAALRAFDLEMESLSDRVKKLESGPPNGGGL
jgi:hypothetical protein